MRHFRYLLFIFLGLLLYGFLLYKANRGDAAPNNSWRKYASDPGGYHLGWGSGHWISSLNKMLVWGGNSHNYKGNNSVRVFDPVMNTWEFLWPNDWTQGVQNRDNHVSFYVPSRGAKGEFWVMGGSYSTAPGSPPGTNFGGRFDLATTTWVNVAHSIAEFGNGLIKDFGWGKLSNGVVSNPAHDWCAELDTGVMFGGNAPNPSNITRLIEPNPQGPEPYRYWEGILPGSPPPRDNVRAQGVCIGSDFYVYGGVYQRPDGQWVGLTDLWKLHLPTRTWTQLASGGQGGGQLVMTYDSLNKVLVVHGGYRRDDVFVYHIRTDLWENMTPTMKTAGDQPWRRYNHVGVYAPTVNEHIYTGGNTWNKDSTEAFYGISAITVGGYTYSDRKVERKNRFSQTIPIKTKTSQTEKKIRVPNKTAYPVTLSGAKGLKNGILRYAQNDNGGAQEVLVGALSRHNWINIPLNTWVARALPSPGKGPCPVGGCKHMRLAHNPVNGRLYFLGGDYSGPYGNESGRNELYSYSIAGGDWKLEYPYCGPAGEVQPGHPDEVGWTYDTTRNRFWMLPGFLYGYTHTQPCPGGATLVADIMAFDPIARKWTHPQVAALQSSGEKGKFAQYDPVTDTIIMFRWDGGMGSVADIFDIRNNRWRTFGLGRDTNGRYINDAHLDKEYMAMDLENRHIYVIDPIKDRLFRYNMDDKTITYLSDLPEPATPDATIPVWDSVNKVLLWPRISNLDGYITLYIYHPDTNTWGKDPMYQPERLTVRGNSAVFDPYQNVLLVMGGLKGGDSDPTVRHFFLYRYGNGSGEGSARLHPRPHR